jgi:peptide-methionine (S)-S-oxide reductase
MFLEGVMMLKRLLLLAVPFTTLGFCASHFPDPATVIPSSNAKPKETVVLAGGCFWGVEAVFESLKGVTSAVSGYAGGNKDTAQYETVSSGKTGHAESVQVIYDPSQITFGQILKVYFSVAHDPTELNRQGPDYGTQYRSSIFYTTEDQKRVAEAYIQQLDAAKVFRHKIVTKVVPLQGFYAAEAYHQHYLVQHPNQPYIVYNDMPKLEQLNKQFPELVKKK